VKKDVMKIIKTDSHKILFRSLKGPGVSVMCAKVAPKLMVTPAYKSPKYPATIGGIIIANEVFIPSESGSP